MIQVILRQKPQHLHYHPHVDPFQFAGQLWVTCSHRNDQNSKNILSIVQAESFLQSFMVCVQQQLGNFVRPMFLIACLEVAGMYGGPYINNVLLRDSHATKPTTIQRREKQTTEGEAQGGRGEGTEFEEEEMDRAQNNLNGRRDMLTTLRNDYGDEIVRDLEEEKEEDMLPAEEST